MNVNTNSTYKFQGNVTEKIAYNVGLKKEILEDLSNQNINEVVLNINDKIGTFTIVSKDNYCKVFNLNIEPIARRDKESSELNIIRSNKSIDCLEQVNTWINIHASPKFYDLPNKRIIGMVDETQNHCAKQIKLPVCQNKNRFAPVVFQNQDNDKSQVNLHQSSHISNINATPSTNTKKISEFSIREKVLNILAPKPASKNLLLLNLRRIGVTPSDLNEVEKHLRQLASLNKDNLYELSKKYVCEINDNWPGFNDDNRRTIAKLKFGAKSNLSSPLSISQMQKEDLLSRKHMNNVSSVLHSLNVKNINTTANISSVEKSFSEKRQSLNLPDKLHNPPQISQNKLVKPEIKKPSIISPRSFRGDRDDTISPAESVSSSKTVTSTDEGFISGDKGTPLKLSSISHSNKRHLPNSTFADNTDSKRMRTFVKNQSFAHNDSSSSCDVTPKSDVSYIKNRNNINDNKIKTNKSDIDDTQLKFNVAYEEYIELCSKLKERQAEIDILKSKSLIAKNSDFMLMYKAAKSLLSKLEAPEFQSMTARVKSLESEMCVHIRIITGEH